MGRNYTENFVEEAFRFCGISDMNGKNIPVVFKRSFVVNEVTEIKAGTLCFINDAQGRFGEIEKKVKVKKKKSRITKCTFCDGTYSSKITDSCPHCGAPVTNAIVDNETSPASPVWFNVVLGFPEFPNVRLFNEVYLHCKAEMFENGEYRLTARGENESVNFADLMECTDERTSADMNEFRDKYNEYYDSETKFEEIQELSFWLSLLLLLICPFVGGVLLTHNLIAGISILSATVIPIATLIICLFANFDKTSKAKRLELRIKSLMEGFAGKEAEFCNQ